MKIKICPVFFVFWFIYIICCDTEFLLHIFVSSIIHEAAHLCTFSFLGVRIEKTELLPFGISVKLHDETALSCKNEIICAFAGPFANMIFGIIIAVINSGKNITDADNLALCSFALFVFNLIPIFPLDGGRILWFVLLEKNDFLSARQIMRRTEYIGICCLSVIGTVLFAIFGNLSVILICIYLIYFIAFENKY